MVMNIMKIVIFGLTLVNRNFFLGCQPVEFSKENDKSTCFDNAYGLAKQYYHRGQYNKAIENFEKFIEENDDSSIYEVALYYLAKSYKNIQDNRNAFLTYQKLISNKGDSFWVTLAREDMGEIALNK